MSELELPEALFRRVDETPDERFYAEPRFVAHIDQSTIDSLTDFYREFLPADARVLDLMSSWISHLPPETTFEHVAGLGMNEAELRANPRLDECRVHNLNTQPELPYAPGSFDRALIAVSVQYLVQPLAVFRSLKETLAPGGAVCIAMSHRLFPTKAILAFQELPPAQRVQLVGTLLSQAGFAEVAFEDRSPAAGDPLWIVIGRR